MSGARVRIFLNAKEEAQIKQGFPWVFDNEIAFVKETDETGKILQHPFAACVAEDGSFAELYSKGGEYLGCGVLNKKSKIPLRLLSRSRMERGLENFDGTFFEERIKRAQEARDLYFPRSASYRLVFAEADLLPGFTADRFCTADGQVFLSVQFLTLGAEVFRSLLIAALVKICTPAGIFERSDVHVRALEGLDEQKGWIQSPAPETEPRIIIVENGVKITVDLENGQKTGYFLDQKWNRERVAFLSTGRRVLDTFSHTGGFSLNAAKGGAQSVTAVDISEDAAAMIYENAKMNGFDHKIKAVCADAFDFLRACEREGTQFDLIVLDPPAFTKSAKMIEKAYGGYKEINVRALKLLSSGGILVTCSCSRFFDAAVFYAMITHAAQDAKKTVQILEKRGPSADHPVLAGYPNSDYLCCAVLRVL